MLEWRGQVSLLVAWMTESDWLPNTSLILEEGFPCNGDGGARCSF